MWPASWLSEQFRFISSHKLYTTVLWFAPLLGDFLLYLLDAYSGLKQDSFHCSDFFFHSSQSSVFHAFLIYLEMILKNSFFCQFLQLLILEMIQWPNFFWVWNKIGIKVRLAFAFKKCGMVALEMALTMSVHHLVQTESWSRLNHLNKHWIDGKKVVPNPITLAFLWHFLWCHHMVAIFVF